MRNVTLFLSLLFSSATLLIGQTVNITDASLEAGQTYNWTNDNTYVVSGLTYLEAGGVLNIEAGTVVQFVSSPQDTSGGNNTSALIITRGAQIFADGTADEPIIFTYEGDDVTDPSDINDPITRGQWGGLIVLGNATIARPGGEDNIEGISAQEPRAAFGGDNDADNSGRIRYLSIRHGGRALSPGNEINGLTLGGVGSGTSIDFVEVYANDDDGIEWFGGTVDVKHAVVSFGKDDSYDYDYGWRGRGQFWFSINSDDISGRAGEHDGASPDSLMPFSNPVIANATYIGSGVGSTPGEDGNDYALVMRDAAGGKYYNSVFTDFPERFINLEDLDPGAGVDSYQRLVDGDISFEGNVVGAFGSGSTFADLVRLYPGGDDPTGATLIAELTAGNSSVGTDQLVYGISRTDDGGLDPRPQSSSPLLDPSPLVDIADNFFRDVRYAGAFGPGANWIEGWTALSHYGFVGDLAPSSTIVINDDDIVAGGNYTWTPNNRYIVDGLVFAEAGAVLTIEAGTVVEFIGSPQDTSGGNNTSALIMAKGSQIFVNGTADNGVIFTYEGDDTTDPFDINDPITRGQWGGLIILGEAVIARPGGSDNIEGISAQEPRAAFGGTNNADNSGRINYLSIRHGGRALSPGNEINGLTLGGVGSGTEIDYVEVYANDDDGIEWFGGTVDVKHAIVSFGKDDSYDYDYGWNGRGQYWFSINSDDISGRAGEHDGASPDSLLPFSNPIIANATYIGSGVNSSPGEDGNDFALVMRDAAGGKYYNSVFTDFPERFINLEDLDPGAGVDSYQRLLDGEIVFEGNVIGAFGSAGAGGIADLVRLYGSGDDPTGATVIAAITGGNNFVNTDQIVNSISRSDDGGLDPRPSWNSAANGAGTTINDAFFDSPSYKGAFSPDFNEFWAKDWTALDHYGFFNEISSSTREVVSIDNVSVFPNPASNGATIAYEMLTAGDVSLALYDINGRMIADDVQRSIGVGAQRAFVGTEGLSNGLYVIRLLVNGQSIIKKLQIQRTN